MMRAKLKLPAFGREALALREAGQRIGLLVVSVHDWQAGADLAKKPNVARVVVPPDLPPEGCDLSLVCGLDVLVCGAEGAAHDMAIRGACAYRAASVWIDTRALESTKAEELKARAEDYRLGSVPAGGLVLTAGVDTQPSRLEVEIKAWGKGLENWVVGYHVLWGDPTGPDVWNRLDEILRTPLLHASGQMLRIIACCVDTGGANTQDVYNYARHRKHMNVLAIKGASRPNRPIIGRPSKVDVRWQGEVEKDGAQLWMVGTDVAKDWIYGRFKQISGPGACHFSKDLPDDYFNQVTSERKIAKQVKGYWKTEWFKKPGDRNEALDVFVYNLAAAYYLSLHAYTDTRWDELQKRINPAQRDMFVAPIQLDVEEEGAGQENKTLSKADAIHALDILTTRQQSVITSKPVRQRLVSKPYR